MGAVIFVLAMAFIFFVISIFLFLGKGSWLIAGYNTASHEEKEKYDKKKLCRATGWICIVVAVMLCVMAYLGYRVETDAMDENAMLPFALIFIIIIIGTVLFYIYYANKKCRKKDYEP